MDAKASFNKKIGNQMQNLYCRNVRNVKFPKIVAEKFAFYTKEYPESFSIEVHFTHNRAKLLKKSRFHEQTCSEF